MSVLDRGQQRAESRMTDACTVRHRTGTTEDDNSGEVTPTWEEVYAGKCRLQQRSATVAEETPGQDFQLLARLELQLPIAAPMPQVGDEVTITAATHDEQLVGRVLIVRDLPVKSEATARRIGVTWRTS